MIKKLLVISLSALACPLLLAGEVSLTLYDDGLSCPADCDSHVVFHPAINGSVHAFDPDQQNEKCIAGEQCRICFDHESMDCLDVTYRGTGPGSHTFDFTPAFYVSTCSKSDLPALLRAKCRSVERAAKRLEDKINCIADPAHRLCTTMMASSVEAKATDQIAYRDCVKVGQSAYNADKPATERRALRCAYEFERNGGPNSKGLRWRKLQPGACRTGTFVGRDGLDCCSGVLIADGPLGIECRIFYPPQSAPQVLTGDKKKSNPASN